DNALGSFTVELHNQMNASKAKIITRKASVGTKNALDFQLAAYLGELITQNKGTHSNYFIVSNDKGYESLISFGRERNVNVELIPNLAGSLIPPEELRQKLTEVLSTCSETEINEIAKIITNASSKTEINGEIGKFIRNSQRAGEIYRSVRSLLSNKKGHS
ncbi:MAG: hypothetical protein IJL01_05955, partial [Synergistaceae bacterium]|nr:hypothetical protein [Synergistaceae bacterium]